ncbi:MAG: hypothetical protein J6K17_09330 [Oscillospiraceae bacterium]|nr:hypothetical protein [Oscillospiraceae bacterium]
MKKCKNCGFGQNQNNQNFCIKCGNPLNTDTEKLTDENVEEAVDNTPSESKKENDKRKNTVLIALGIVGIIVISVAVSVTVSYVMMKDIISCECSENKISTSDEFLNLDNNDAADDKKSADEESPKTVQKSKLVDIVGNDIDYIPDIEVEASLADISRAQYVELIEDVKYCDEMYSFVTGGYCSDKFYYEYSVLETIYENESMYCEVNSELATNLDEMYLAARKCFTENYISDDALYEIMFESEYGYPTFKMINNYLGVYTWTTHWSRQDDLDFENAGVVSYSETNAEVWVAEEDRIGGGGYMFTNIYYMSRDSESDNWKIDKFETTNHY